MDGAVDVASGVAGIAGVAIAVAGLVALHVLPTGLSAVHNPVSQYGITPYRSGYRVQTLGYALAGTAVAVGLFTLPGPPVAVAVFCLLFAAARAVISWFPMDAPGSERTGRGARHGWLAVVTFVSIAIAASQLQRTARADHLGHAVLASSEVIGVLMLVTLITMAAARRSGLRQYFGLVERSFYLLTTLWLLLIASALIRTA